MKNFSLKLLAVLLISSSISCTAMIDFLSYALESDYCCTAFDSSGCEIGRTNSFDECQDMLEDEYDYCQCNCPD